MTILGKLYPYRPVRAACATCGDIPAPAEANIGQTCGRDLSEEHGQPAGVIVCYGTYTSTSCPN